MSFASSPNYEDPTDSDADNQYDVTIQASDGTNTSTLQVTVIVTNVRHDADELPVITGTAQVGETLTVDTSPIPDTDQNTRFVYLWIRTDGETDTNIDGAANSSYTLTADEEGKSLKVLVGFRTTGGERVRLTSAATVLVTAAPASNNQATGVPTVTGTAQVGETLTADTTGIADQDGLADAEFSYQWLADDTAITGATSSSYTLTDSEEVKTIKVKVSFTDDGGNDESLTSEATAAVAAAPPDNSPATGAPTISGTVQVGETLTANTTGIADSDGLDNAQFDYQWLADDMVISGATASTYTLAAADEGKAIKVKVNFTDDGGNAESLTSTATAAVASSNQTPKLAGLTVSPGTLTPSFDEDTTRYSVPDLANAENRITISNTANPGYTVVFIKAVHAVGACVPGGSSCEWSYQDEEGNKVGPLTDGDADTTGFQVDLNPGDNKLMIQVLAKNEPEHNYYRLTITRASNSLATGAPTISGTAQVGETLTADTTGIADADGLSGVAFTYQWVANDGTSDMDITGATGSTYTLVAANEGKAIRVRVAFTDDAANDETLTSTATATVSFAVQQQVANSLATGAPAITGTAQVGETLTADTSGIADR